MVHSLHVLRGRRDIVRGLACYATLCAIALHLLRLGSPCLVKLPPYILGGTCGYPDVN